MISFVLLLCVGSVVSQGISKDSSVCSLPPEIGTCRAALPAFFYNSTLGYCDCFIYGGCNPSGNLFLTLQECSDTCGVNPSLRFITPTCRRLFPSRLTTTTPRPTAPPQPSTNGNQRFNETSLSQLEKIFNQIVSSNQQQNTASRPANQLQPSQQDFRPQSSQQGFQQQPSQQGFQPQPSQQGFQPQPSQQGFQQQPSQQDFQPQPSQQGFQPQPSQQGFRPPSQSVQSQAVPQRPRPTIQLDIPEPRPRPQTTPVRAPPKEEGPIFPPRVPGVRESAAVLAQRRQQQQLQETIRRQQEFERREQMRNEEQLKQQRQQQLQQQSGRF